MAKKDSDLFDRLRKAGVRKQAAKTLSEIGEGASKKATSAARTAIAELRALADELERRLPAAAVDAGATRAKRSSRRVRATRTPQRARAASKPAARTGARRTAAGGRAAARPPASTAASARAPRGQNKAKILQALKSGPKTASEVARETGIGTGTVSSTLTKLTATGEAVRATRGYTLPS